MRWLLLAAVAAASLLASVDADAQEAVQLRIDAVDSSAFPQVRATVTALDASGRPLTDLPFEAFLAHSGDRALPVTGVAGATSEGLGIAVTLAFDVSGSMKGLPLTQAKEAGKALVAELGPEDQVAVLAFADSVQVVQPFTRDRDALAAAIDGLLVSGNTGLYQAVAASFDLARSADSPRRAVVLLSDGQDYGGLGTVTRDASLDAARSSGVPLFTVGLGDLVDQPYLAELAAAARGQLLLAADPQALQGLYQAVGAVLRHQYVVTVDASALEGATSAVLRVDVSYAGATAFAEASLALPAPPPAPAPETPNSRPVQPPTGQAEAEPQPEKAKGGAGLLPAVAGGAAAVLAIAVLAGALAWRKRALRSRRNQDEEFTRRPGAPGPLAPAWTAAGLPPAPAPGARLTLTTPAGEETYSLGDYPVTVGFTPECGICLPTGSGSRWERVRIWRRDGRYMLHTLSRVGVVSISGKPVPWAVLEDGDEIRLGACTLTFREGA